MKSTTGKQMDIYEQLHQAVSELRQRWPELFRARVIRVGSVVGIDDSGFYVVDAQSANDMPIGIVVHSADENSLVSVRMNF